MSDLSRPTADDLLAAFSSGVFAVADPGAPPPAVSGWGGGGGQFHRVEIRTGDVSVETARDRNEPLSLVVHDLMFHRLVEHDLSFPLTLTVDRFEVHPRVASEPHAFDAYVLDGYAVAVGTCDGVRIRIRCSEEVVKDIRLERLDRSGVERAFVERRRS